MDRKDMIAVIQAGGKGSRMYELTGDKIPKPMLLLDNKPMLQWQIENVASYGIKRFVIITGHLGEQIEEYFKDGSALGVEISYIRESEPLGSAGALYYLKDMENFDDFLVIFGDVMIEIDWDRMIAFHKNHDATATLLVHPNAHPYDSDLLMLDENSKVIGMDSKNNTRDYWYDNIVNAGIYIFNRKILENISQPKKTDLEKDVICKEILNNNVWGYRTPEYVKDAGTPERFKSVENEKISGVWDKKCLKNKQRCVFLDRDGTLNAHKGLLYKEEDFELEEGVAEGIHRLNKNGILAIVITNQPVVARGLCQIEDVNNIHKKLQVLLGQEGAYLDDIEFCPHHPDKGYPEENPLYKIKCECRKPATGMIDKMVEKYNIDLSHSYIVGDTTMDIQTGINAGIGTVLVRTGEAGADKKYDVTPQFCAKSFLDAIDYIISEIG